LWLYLKLFLAKVLLFHAGLSRVKAYPRQTNAKTAKQKARQNGRLVG